MHIVARGWSGGGYVIICDSREHNQDYICDRLKSAGIEHTVTCLQHGMDYLILGTYGEIGVQRKTFPEVATQMQAIREDIIPSLMECTEHPVLLIEETFRVDTAGMMWRKEGNFMKPASITARMYYSFLQSIRNMGCEVVCTRELEQSIWWMYSVHSYIHEVHYPKQKKGYGGEAQAIGALCCINSFGITAAKKLLAEHTIADLSQMSELQLHKIMNKNQVHNFRRAICGIDNGGKDDHA